MEFEKGKMYDYIKFEEAKKLAEMYINLSYEFGTDDENIIIKHLGLKFSENPNKLYSNFNFWCNSISKKSYLQIVDKQKWLLTKIKYGI